MKLTQLIREATAYPAVTEADVNNLCDVTGSITIVDNVVNVEGDVTLKSIKVKTLKVLPFKFGNVKGKFDAQDGFRLESLINFPDQCNEIDITDNIGMKSFAGGENILCATFKAVDTQITSFEGCPTSFGYDFTGTVGVTSTVGIPTNRLGAITLTKCTNLRDIRNIVITKPTYNGVCVYDWNPDFPMLGPILLAKVPGRLDFSLNEMKVNPKFLTIYREYKGKGLGFIIELADELRNKGFEGNARF